MFTQKTRYKNNRRDDLKRHFTLNSIQISLCPHPLGICPGTVKEVLTPEW